MLISMGQGFALSYVINLPQIHSMDAAENPAPVPPYLLVCGHDFREALREAPSHSHKSHQELLSLSCDPFLPSVGVALPLRTEEWDLFFSPSPRIQRFDLPFKEPPKALS